MACLDTSCLLDVSGRGGPILQVRAKDKLRRCRERGEGLFTPRLTAAELYVGIHRAKDPHAEEQCVRNLLSGVEIIEFDDRAARRYGEITAQLQRIGRPIGDMDALIAATTLAAGDYLVTRNAAHFANVPGLVVEEH